MKRQSWLALILLSIFLLTACSTAATPPAFEYNNSTNSSSGAKAPAAPPAPGNGPITAPAAALDQSGTTGSGGNAAAVQRLVIKTANLTLLVPDPVASMDAIAKLADSLKGYVVSSNSFKTQKPDGGEIPEASITIRVPAESLNDALIQIKGQVKDASTDILSENVTGQDITKEYTDLQSQLKNQQAAADQLREIMASATKPEDVLNIFNQLNQVQSQIEVLKGQIQYYEESAAMSAINVSLKAEASVAPLTIGTWQPVGVARTAVQTLIETLKFLAGVVIWLVLYILPVFLIIFIPLRLLWAGIRRLRANRKNQKAAVPPAAPTPPAAS